MISVILNGQITDENMGDKNFRLGRLDVLNHLISEELFDDLIDSMGEEDR